MGLSESSLQSCNEILKTCITDVLGSFDCTCKSKCMEKCKCMNLYYHCRTTRGDDIVTVSEDEITPSVIDTLSNDLSK